MSEERQAKKALRVEKRAIIMVRLVPTPEAYKDKSNRDVEKEILEEKPAIPYVAEIERTSVFNSLAGEVEAVRLKEMVMNAFKPVHTALAETFRKLAEKGILADTYFKAEKGILVVTLEKQREES
jgi:hypothetical protein